MAMRLLDLFSGIGGFSYAAETLIGGYETVAFCEMDEFCQKVLKKHWPSVPIYDDVRTLDAARLGRIDICTFGFPCQPVSQAGLQKAESDDRWLWDEIIRILQVSKPKYIIAENVRGLISIQDGLLIEKCLSDLEAEGYEVQPIIIPACAKNAPHRRDRVWIIGQNVDDSNDSSDRAKRGKTREKNSLQKEYRQTGFSWFSDRTSDDSEPMANSENNRGEQTQWQGGESVRGRSDDFSRSETEEQETVRTNVANTDNERLQGHREHRQLEREQREKQFAKNNLQNEHRTNRKFEQRMGDMADGISAGLLRHFDREPEHIPRVTKGEKDRSKKLRALGNSIVPQVAAEILLAIRISEESV